MGGGDWRRHGKERGFPSRSLLEGAYRQLWTPNQVVNLVECGIIVTLHNTELQISPALVQQYVPHILLTYCTYSTV